MNLSALALEHVTNQRNRGELAEHDLYGESGSPGGGPYVQIWLRMSRNTVIVARYETHGCPSSIACASLLCDLAVGRKKEALLALEPQELIVVLGGIPEGKEQFANLAIEALRCALEN